MKKLSLFFFLFLLLSEKIRSAEGPDEFILITIPKSGTHLLQKTLNQLLDRATYRPPFDFTSESLLSHLNFAKENNSFLRLHIPPLKNLVGTLRENNTKVIFLLRDPRDQVVSLLFFILKGEGSYPTLTMRNPEFADLSFNEQLMELITGEKWGYSIVSEVFMRRILWLDFGRDFVLPIKFEELVGDQGGGTREAQLNAVRKIAHYLHLILTDEELQNRSLGLFGKPGDRMFRAGQIGEWKKYFTQEHKDAFKARWGEALIQLGYENDLKW